ncbi:MAG: serine/threonine protein kinase [Cyanobacteria bacterium SZAS LIN-3]|nr:serine/threonine protein kinase [Cyanobacteria bacterium SZAS LIN-3]
MAKSPESKRRDLCPKCGKRIESQSHAGSITSYMFQGNHCSCGKEAPAARASDGSGNDPDFCKKCGLRKRSEGKAGSITGFLFQDLRCKCPDDPAEEQVASFPGKRIKLSPGTVIGGTYRIVKRIGQGGMGEVYLAEHDGLKKNFALKVIPADQVTEIGWLRFQTEAKSVAKLNHPNLVKVSDLGMHEGCLPFYAMEYVEGKSMADLLQTQGPMPLKTALSIFDQICDGLDYSHRNGIIHRDVKPANIMLSKKPDGSIAVKVLDFGLAKLTQADRHRQSLTAVGEMLGSPFYMSPEQCEGTKIDRRSDIYSLGCALFECLVGQPPFNQHLPSAIIESHLHKEAPSLEDIVGPGVFPDSIEVVLAKLLRKNPVERYQSMSELRGDLQLVGEGKNVKPFYMSRSGQGSSLGDAGEEAERRPSPAKNRSRILVGFTALVILTVLVSLGFLALHAAK